MQFNSKQYNKRFICLTGNTVNHYFQLQSISVSQKVMLMHYNGKNLTVKYLKFHKPLASRTGMTTTIF